MVTAGLIRAMSEHRNNIAGGQENADSDTRILGVQEEGYNPDETPKFAVTPNLITTPIPEKNCKSNNYTYPRKAEQLSPWKISTNDCSEVIDNSTLLTRTIS